MSVTGPAKKIIRSSKSLENISYARSPRWDLSTIVGTIGIRYYIVFSEYL
jgi:hypothetical protein